jgi:hypothetical protein
MNRYPAQARSPQHRRPLVFLVLLAVLGCGGNKNVGQVSGTVTYQGNRLPIGSVSFLDSNNQWLTSAPIAKGWYVIPVKVPVGPVKIIVTTPGASSGESGRRRSPVARKHKAGEPTSVISIPAKYGSADQSGLTYTVQPGSQKHHIDLQ